jgi:hypothetical protein
MDGCPSMRLCIRTGITVNEVGMDMMIDDETSITYQRAREMGIARRVKNAWKEDVSKRRFSREVLAKALSDWRKGEHELIVRKCLVSTAELSSRKKLSGI